MNLQKRRCGDGQYLPLANTSMKKPIAKSYSKASILAKEQLLVQLILLLSYLIFCYIEKFIPWQLILGLSIISNLIYEYRRKSWKKRCLRNTVLLPQELYALKKFCQTAYPGSYLESKPYGAILYMENSGKRSAVNALQKKFSSFQLMKEGAKIQIIAKRKKKEKQLFSENCREIGLESSWYGEIIYYQRKSVEVMGVDLDNLILYGQDIQTGKIVEISI